MRKTLMMLSSVALTSFALMGCDKQAAETQLALDNAIAQISKADVGFVQQTSATDKTFSQTRLEQLKAALGDLKTVTANGSDAQKVIAGKLQAEIELAIARSDMQAAKDAYASIASQSASMLRYVVAVDNADFTVKEFDTNQNALYKQIKEEQSLQNEEVAARNAERATLQEKLDKINNKKEAFIAKAKEHFAAAQTLDNQAFTASGDTKFKLQNEADAVRRKASQAMAEADKHQAAADRLEVAIKLNSVAAKAGKTVISDLDNRRDLAKTEDAAAKQNKQQAIADRDSIYETLRQEFNQITNSYTQDITEKYEKAIAGANKAVSTLKSVQSAAKGASRADLQSNLLVALTGSAHAYTEFSATAASFGDILKAILANTEAVSDDEADVINKIYNAVAQQQAEAIKSGNEIITEALDLAGQLDDENANVYVAHLQNYASQLEKSSLE
ncbi:hypothetical protein [Poriferisphaera sp. WC338]|uniref:hypothetical protein n=1 Tax=Poriferisphaera sp. WC338 TaxID=3425129 RepID=UPI003D81B5FB